MYAGEVANLLKEVKTDKKVGLNVMICPQHVPGSVALHAADHPPSQLICHFFNNIVMGH